MRFRTISRHGSEDGVGLIEVLIALLVLSVGILGMVTMQLAAKKSSYEATQRSIATGLARDILERMRTNPGQVNDYIVTNHLSASITKPTPDCGAAPCDPNELADYDLWDWSELLRGSNEFITGTTTPVGGLVDPRACITNTNGNVTVAIAWRGISELKPDPGATVTCGEANLYDSASGGVNYLRRMLVMTTFIEDI